MISYALHHLLIKQAQLSLQFILSPCGVILCHSCFLGRVAQKRKELILTDNLHSKFLRFPDFFRSRFLSGKEVDADYTILQAEELSENMALWQKIAESGIITDVYAMYDYVNFLCAWNTYYVDNSTDENGNTVPGYYLYPSDAEHYIYTDGAQWNYGYQEGYFEDIIRRIQAVDATAFQDLVDNVMQAQALAEEALAELENQNYTSEYQYVEAFGREDYVYTLDRGDELAEKMQALYTDFSNWLGSWEM